MPRNRFQPLSDSFPATSETRVITPITATISIIDSLSAKNGNQGLEASKFAKPGFVPRVSNSSRPRNTALAPRDPNAGSGNIEVTKSSAPETRKSSDSYQNRVVEQFRKEHEETKMEGRFVKFEKAEGSPGKSISITWNSTNMMLVAPEKAAAVKNTVDTTGAPAEIVTATMNTPLPAISVNAPADTSTAASGQDRLEATYFASWGAPEARSGPSKSYNTIASLHACANMEQRQKFAAFFSRVCLPVLTMPLLRLWFTAVPSNRIGSPRSAILRLRLQSSPSPLVLPRRPTMTSIPTA